MSVSSNARILTQPLLLSYHVFSNMHQTRMNIGDFYDLSEKLTNLAEPGASITWAKEIKILIERATIPSRS
jgi:hypothetical protein